MTRHVYVVVAAIRTGACQDDAIHAMLGKVPLISRRWATGPFLLVVEDFRTRPEGIWNPSRHLDAGE